MKKPVQKSLQAWKLKEQIDKKTIDLDAPYQRGIVWAPQKMSDLIDSLLFNFYVPPLVFAIRKVNSRIFRTCVDGKQRLTSVAMFMNNEIPYYDRSVDPAIPKYYSIDTDKNKTNGDVVYAGRQYLNDDEVIRFNQVELICVEYNQLTEDDEYDVFSRVQMGVQISPAEKLRAHNTAVAKKIRELAEKYTGVAHILPSLGNLATLFKTIAEFFVCLDSEPETFNITSTKVANYIKTSGILKANVVQRAELALILLTKMINYHASFRALTRYPSHLKKTMVKIELLTLLYYLSLCSQNRSLDDLAEDCNDMRAMFHNWDQRLYLGAKSWSLGVMWCKQKWEENRQSRNTLLLGGEGDNMVFTGTNGLLTNGSAVFTSQNQRSGQPFIFINSDGDDDDEEKVYTPTQPLASGSRKRLLNPARSNRPVAKRGGKAPRLV